MKRQVILAGLSLIYVTSMMAMQVDPRGARPIENAMKADKCDTEKSWPFCTDDDWGRKCPSGCRIQGLLDKYDHDLLKKIEKIRNLLDQNRAKHRSADQISKQTYDYLKDKLVTDANEDNSYYDLAQNLRQRIVDLKINIDRQLRSLQAMKERVKDQVTQIQRLEVDIDIKLRSCKGSCKGYAEFSVDQESYVALDKQVDQLETYSGQSVDSVSTMYVMKSRLMKDGVVDSVFKSKTVEAQKSSPEERAAFFPEVETRQLFVESEGSASSPASVSKIPGTTFPQSSSSSSSSSSSFSSSSSLSSSSSSGSTKSITMLGGGEGDMTFDMLFKT